MTTRNILLGLGGAVALFVVGSVIGGVWDDSDTAGAITVTLWAINVIAAALLVVALIVQLVRRRA